MATSLVIFAFFVFHYSFSFVFCCFACICGGSDLMTATAVTSCCCIPDYVFCTWSWCRNKLNWTTWRKFWQERLHLCPYDNAGGMSMFKTRVSFIYCPRSLKWNCIPLKLHYLSLMIRSELLLWPKLHNIVKRTAVDLLVFFHQTKAHLLQTPCDDNYVVKEQSRSSDQIL